MMLKFFYVSESVFFGQFSSAPLLSFLPIWLNSATNSSDQLYFLKPHLSFPPKFRPSGNTVPLPYTSTRRGGYHSHLAGKTPHNTMWHREKSSDIGHPNLGEGGRKWLLPWHSAKINGRSVGTAEQSGKRVANISGVQLNSSGKRVSVGGHM